MKASKFQEIVCDVCGKTFQPIRANQKRCSDSCRRKAAFIYRQEHYHPRPRPKAYKPREHSNLSIKRIKKPEKVLVENMPELNKTVKHDGDRLKAKNIVSPDLSKINHRHYDPVMRITRFFRGKEQYDRFLETLNN